jgi:hypothetical protein
VSGTTPGGLEAGLDAVAGFLGPDGASIVVEQWDDTSGHLSVRLVLETAECAECVVPRPMLDTLLLDTLRGHAPAIRAVVLDDPRERS